MEIIFKEAFFESFKEWTVVDRYGSCYLSVELVINTCYEEMEAAESVECVEYKRKINIKSGPGDWRGCYSKGEAFKEIY